ncbi:MAG: hypothetical protein ACRDY2_00115 [Acidimicrobiales bacterium]
MTSTQDDALEVLRTVWSGQGQGQADIDEACGNTKVCKNMEGIGFEGLADDSGDVAGSWRETLDREGKRQAKPGSSIRDVVLGSE